MNAERYIVVWTTVDEDGPRTEAQEFVSRDQLEEFLDDIRYLSEYSPRVYDVSNIEPMWV